MSNEVMQTSSEIASVEYRGVKSESILGIRSLINNFDKQFANTFDQLLLNSSKSLNSWKLS